MESGGLGSNRWGKGSLGKTGGGGWGGGGGGGGQGWMAVPYVCIRVITCGLQLVI